MKPENLAWMIRQKCLELSFKKKSSHLGGSLSVADILGVLYSNVMRVKADDPQWDDRDRLFYSKGHACMALYSCLEALGFYSDLVDKFTKDGEMFTSHVNHKVPGVELSTGSLGHALPVATGTALAGKKKNKNWRVFCIVSDGELDEGSNWEAILLAPHLKLDNLVLVVDYNKIQSFGNTNEVVNLEPLASKFEAFNWNVYQVNGHDYSELTNVLSNHYQNEKPTVVLAHTVKGKGISFMENSLDWHYKSPTEEQYQKALKELGIG